MMMLASRQSASSSLSMLATLFLSLVSLTTQSVSALAPLELPNGSPIYFGTWFDRLHGDTAVATNSRLNYKPLSMFQSDVNITDTLQSAFVDDIIAKIAATQTDAIVYLTVYPIQGFSIVTPAAISALAQKIATLANGGSRVFLRYASEMNGAWFQYGQQPTAFIAQWKQVVSAVRAAVTKNPNNVAFIWAPNSGNGYPFPDYEFSALPGTSDWDPALDTNGDGAYTALDDPYSPFYPGDAWVDWVGMSTYHYGYAWLGPSGTNPSGWITNDVPGLGKIEGIIQGTWQDAGSSVSPFNFYKMFCGTGTVVSAGSKPFIMTETAATIHLAVNQTTNVWVAPANSDATSRVAIKQAWWRQMLNATFLQQFPKVKAICFFEFIKFEEESWRDFSSLGGDFNLTSPLGNDGASKDGPTLAAFQSDLSQGMDKLIIWGNNTPPAAPASVIITSSTAVAIAATSANAAATSPAASSGLAPASMLDTVFAAIAFLFLA